MVESQRERDYSSEVPLIEDEDVVESQVQDSSVDYKGSLAPRATTGSWKASYFIIGNLILYSRFTAKVLFTLCIMSNALIQSFISLIVHN